MPFLVAEAVSGGNITGLLPIINEIIDVAKVIISFALTTFPINVGVIGGIVGVVVGVVRKSGKAAKTN